MKKTNGRASRPPSGDRLTRSQIARRLGSSGRTVASYLDDFDDAPKPDEHRRYSLIEVKKHIAARVRASLLRNAWRHSFGTYMLAQEGSFARAAYLMQHTRPVTTLTHYEGRATRDDAKLYFSITPDLCRTMDWETFRRWVLKPEPVLEPESVTRYHVSAPIAPRATERVQAGPRDDWRAG